MTQLFSSTSMRMLRSSASVMESVYSSAVTLATSGSYSAAETNCALKIQKNAPKIADGPPSAASTGRREIRLVIIALRRAKPQHRGGKQKGRNAVAFAPPRDLQANCRLSYDFKFTPARRGGTMLPGNRQTSQQPSSQPATACSTSAQRPRRVPAISRNPEAYQEAKRRRGVTRTTERVPAAV